MSNKTNNNFDLNAIITEKQKSIDINNLVIKQ